MKTLKCLFALMIIAWQCFGQQGIYGGIFDAQKKPLSMVEFRLHSADTVAIAAVLSNTEGQFGFDIDSAGKYHVEVLTSDSTSTFLYGVTVEPNKPVEFVLWEGSEPKTTRKNFMRRPFVFSSQQLEKMPSTDAKEILASTSTFANEKAGQPMRSLTAPGRDPVTYIVDGMVVPNGSPMLFTPGSLQSVEVIKK